jgi:hypothetical protein
MPRASTGLIVLAFVGASILAFLLGRTLTLALGAEVAAFDSGFLATVAGIAVGVPIAIALARWQQARADASIHAVESKRRADVTDLIRRDLIDIRAELISRIPSRSYTSMTPFLGSGLFATLRASDDLRLLEPARLQSVSRAYDRIAVTAYLERRAWEGWYDQEWRINRTSTILQEQLAALAEQDEHTRAAIDVALEDLPALAES